ncbi:MAG: SigB/SigF/SigG family RNA polymerase sigma factor [Candidatus Nanopelagicales bacterium]
MADGVERRETEDALFARLRDPNTDEASRRAIRSELVEMHTPLARHIARRYADRGEPVDDVVQAGNIGLINAVDRFEPDRGLAFSTYAVPTIIGAIRRYFRDSTWSVKVPRRLQEMRGRIDSSSDRLTQEFGRAPTIAEIAAHAGVDAQDVLDSLELGRVRESTSIDATATGEAPLADRLGVDDASLAGVEDEETVRRLLNTLPARERAIVVMRFFDGMSQSQIAEHVGLSQMHVSRLLAQSLTRLRSEVLT